ncbi:spidroin-1-like isoform X1 [Lethenteron reissneri]|uniref:spidroin-1-like isoform X1 n=1 Tax=Lethenteron reissneri TaxID=7753 RepID=UPI002AB7243D|nr:spidroin-1-like isoform X1 [Lethenteron reissneri]
MAMARPGRAVATCEASGQKKEEEATTEALGHRAGGPEREFAAAAALFGHLRADSPADRAVLRYGERRRLGEPGLALLHGDSGARRRSYALAFSALKYQTLIEGVLVESGFYSAQLIPDDLLPLAVVLFWDLQRRGFEPRDKEEGREATSGGGRGASGEARSRQEGDGCGGDGVHDDVREVDGALFSFRTRLRASLARGRIRRGALSLDSVLPEPLLRRERRAGAAPLYAWVDGTRSSEEEVQRALCDLGFSQVESLGDRQDRVFSRDRQLADLLVFPGQRRSELLDSDIAERSALVFQVGVRDVTLRGIITQWWSPHLARKKRPRPPLLKTSPSRAAGQVALRGASRRRAASRGGGRRRGRGGRVRGRGPARRLAPRRAASVSGRRRWHRPHHDHHRQRQRHQQRQRRWGRRRLPRAGVRGSGRGRRSAAATAAGNDGRQHQVSTGGLPGPAARRLPASEGAGHPADRSVLRLGVQRPRGTGPRRGSGPEPPARRRERGGRGGAARGAVGAADGASVSCDAIPPSAGRGVQHVLAARTRERGRRERRAVATAQRWRRRRQSRSVQGRALARAAPGGAGGSCGRRRVPELRAVRLAQRWLLGRAEERGSLGISHCKGDPRSGIQQRLTGGTDQKDQDQTTQGTENSHQAQRHGGEESRQGFQRRRQSQKFRQLAADHEPRGPHRASGQWGDSQRDCGPEFGSISGSGNGGGQATDEAARADGSPARDAEGNVAQARERRGARCRGGGGGEKQRGVGEGGREAQAAAAAQRMHLFPRNRGIPCPVWARPPTHRHQQQHRRRQFRPWILSGV